MIKIPIHFLIEEEQPHTDIEIEENITTIGDIRRMICEKYGYHIDDFLINETKRNNNDNLITLCFSFTELEDEKKASEFKELNVIYFPNKHDTIY